MIGRRQFFERCGLMMLLSRSIGRCVGATQNSAGSCGIDPFAKRILFSWTPGIPHIQLASVYVRDGRSIIEIALRNKLHEAKPYYSVDRGNTWTIDPLDTANYTNLNIRGYTGRFTGIADGQNPSVLYRTAAALTQIEVSTNSGAQWNTVLPKINSDNKDIKRIDLIGTGRRTSGRLYANISWDGDGDNFPICRSDDYGRSFSVVSSDLSYMVESRANPDVLIGITRADSDAHHEIVVSLNNGVSWRKTKSNILREHLFRNVKDGVIRTVAESADDVMFHNYAPVIQIESDPIDTRTFYVVTWTGLYSTFDQGETFRLLPIANQYISAIDSVSVDPTDSRYIYASVKGSNLYYSADKGCTWATINMPEY